MAQADRMCEWMEETDLLFMLSGEIRLSGLQTVKFAYIKHCWTHTSLKKYDL